MKSFDSRVYSINDYREWELNDQLVLSPRFQRRAVWTETARSYLMDTIVRGLPIPKIFLRQRVDPGTGRFIREVVDGQQRLRTISAFLSDQLVIKRSHNEEWGGLFFSQLEEERRLLVLNYELSTDLLINISDSEVLDIFSRLNSHAVVVNEQERINANHFGPFKVLADELAHEYFEYWLENRILTESQVMRMGDVSLTADLLIAMCEGIRSKKQVRTYYSGYETEFDHDAKRLAAEFVQVLAVMQDMFPEGLRGTEFRRIHLYYSLFTCVYHELFGLQGMPDDLRVVPLRPVEARQKLDHVERVFDAGDPAELGSKDRQFLTDSRRATTDGPVRARRTAYLLGLIKGEQDDLPFFE